MVRVRTESIIDLADWDELVMNTYGKPYSFQQQDDCQDRGIVYLTVPEEADDYPRDKVPEVINGSVMGVSFESWLARDPKEWNGKKEDKAYLNLFWDRNFYPNVQIIANDLYKRGLLPAGEYGINIDW